ncbi:MAG: glycosyltransferase family 4 protein [Myxococcales bacterium]|nr:glycosyltransferase family 4 protein [Myxococcales bacterium]
MDPAGPLRRDRAAAPLRLAILMSHPIQYHVPIFRELAARDDVDLTVYFCWDFGIRETYDREFGRVIKWDVPMLGGYEHRFLPNWSPRPGPTFFGEINPSIVSTLIRGRFDAVLVYGYSHLTSWFAFLGAKLSGTPLLLRGISHLLDERPGWVRAAKRLLLPFVFRLPRFCLYIGAHNRAYYEAYGVDDDRLLHTPHVVDNRFFARHAAELAPQRAEVRASFGIHDDAPVILFPGKLVEWKNPLMTLEAFRRVRTRHRCHLLYAGEGAQRGELEEAIRQGAVPDVVVAGFLNQTEMPRAYAAADILCLPSRATETWGLVVNEGMSFGLPVIVSDRVGCGVDLARDGENGFVVDSVDALERALEALVADADLRSRYGARSREIIASWGVPECADGIVGAVRRIVEERGA